MAESKGVMVFGEVADGGITGTTAELLGKGRELAQALGEEVIGVVFAGQAGNAAQEMIAHGADKVYVAEDPSLGEYDTDIYTTALAKLCNEVTPNIVLMGHTVVGRDLAPRLAFRLETGLGTDCAELSIDPDSKLMVQTRPVYGGNAQATVVVESARPQMATVRPKAMTPLERDDSRTGEVTSWQAGVDQSMAKTKVVDRVKAQLEGMKLEEAPVIVAGGRGIGSAEAFKELEELAGVFKGLVGATRAACDSGFASPSIQIGITGKVVSPGLYFAVAISGASQHMSGCLGSKVIVSINKDADANVFKDSQYGVVGDYREVLPAFMAKCKELLGS
ncbi:MAG: electron transfer flavoprotein subunit alpha/FixB family protein [Dehalococcoidia bacterium]